ncbi:hypothetical protein HN873_043861, partial [Arachis hypogaea]
VPVLGKGKVSMKITSEKTLVLSDELYVLAIKHCLVSVHLLNNDMAHEHKLSRAALSKRIFCGLVDVLQP